MAKSGSDALSAMALIPMMNSMPMFMKCLWTSGSVNVPRNEATSSSVRALPASATPLA